MPTQAEIELVVESFLRSRLWESWQNLRYDRALWGPIFESVFGFLPQEGACLCEDAYWDVLVPITFRIMQKLDAEAKFLRTEVREVA